MCGRGTGWGSGSVLYPIPSWHPRHARRSTSSSTADPPAAPARPPAPAAAASPGRTGTPPAASANAWNAAITGSCWACGSTPRSRASSERRQLVTAATRSRRAGVSVIRTVRRSPACRCRRTRPLRTRRSHMRVAVEGFTARAAARSAVPCGRLAASTTRARYCGSLTSSPATARDRAATRDQCPAGRQHRIHKLSGSLIRKLGQRIGGHRVRQANNYCSRQLLFECPRGKAREARPCYILARRSASSSPPRQHRRYGPSHGSAQRARHGSRCQRRLCHHDQFEYRIGEGKLLGCRGGEACPVRGVARCRHS